MTREDNLKEQLELYASQYEAMSKGVNDKKTNMGTFKTQVDNLNQKLKGLEADTIMWKEKFEESNDIVVKMNANRANSDRELEAIKRKLAAMEKLNRALQAERSDLLNQVKAQNGNHWLMFLYICIAQYRDTFFLRSEREINSKLIGTFTRFILFNLWSVFLQKGHHIIIFHATFDKLITSQSSIPVHV